MKKEIYEEKMMTKVCHITSAHSQRDIRIFEKECISLAKMGYEVHLVAPGEDTLIGGVQIHGIGAKPISRMKRMLFFSRKAYKKALSLQADIYHFHDPELIPYGLLLKKKNKKVIFDSHENVLEQFEEKEYLPYIIRKTISGVFARYVKQACRKFDAVISVDTILCEKYKEINPNTVMVANFPELEEMKRDVQHKRYICFAGGISAQWNHDVIIDAINEIDDFSYVLCGNADESYLEYLKTLPGWKKVDYRGKVSHKEALELVQGGCAGVALCSYSNNTNGAEGTLGNTKLFEIMMCGLPVICTDFRRWREIVEKNKCGYCVHYRDKDKLKEWILKILASKQEAETMGRNGRTVVEKVYNWETQEKNLEDLYENINNKQ